jgi:hypothetical protein
MAIDFSIDGISVHAGATGISLSINDLAGLGIDLNVDVPVGGGGAAPFHGSADMHAADTHAGAADGNLESLLSQFTSGAPVFAPEDGGAEPAAAPTDSFDAATLASLTLLGGADDTAGPDSHVDPLTGA